MCADVERCVSDAWSCVVSSCVSCGVSCGVSLDSAVQAWVDAWLLLCDHEDIASVFAEALSTQTPWWSSAEARCDGRPRKPRGRPPPDMSESFLHAVAARACDSKRTGGDRSADPMDALWSTLDLIQCITLRERPERRGFAQARPDRRP